MIRLFLIFLVALGFTYLIYQLLSHFKYRASIYFKIDQDLNRLDEEMNRYRDEIVKFQNTKADLYTSYASIKQPPADVRELYELRDAVLQKEINLYRKIIKLYEQYKAALEDKKQVMKFKAKHGNGNESAEEISDALFKVKEMRSDIKTNLKISYYDQISGGNELSDLKGSLKHLEEIESKSDFIDDHSSDGLEHDIQDDFLVLKELVRQKNIL